MNNNKTISKTTGIEKILRTGLVAAALCAPIFSGCKINHHIDYLIEYPIVTTNDSVETDRIKIQTQLVKKDSGFAKEDRYKKLKEIIYDSQRKYMRNNKKEVDDAEKETRQQSDGFYTFETKQRRFYLYDTENPDTNMFQIDIFSSDATLPYGICVGNSRQLVENMLGKANYTTKIPFNDWSKSKYIYEHPGETMDSYIFPALSSRKDRLEIYYDSDNITQISIIHEKNETAKSCIQKIKDSHINGNICPASEFETGMID